MHQSHTGTRFVTRVFEDNGWWFKWWNITDMGQTPGNPVAQNVDGPFPDRDAAEDARRRFKDQESRKRPLVSFED